MKRTLTTLAILAAISGASLATEARAENLLDVWQAAKGHDREYLEAQSEQAAGEARRDAGDTLLRPSVNLVVSAGAVRQDSSMTGAQFSQPALGTFNNASFNTSINSGTQTRYALQATQPLYDPALSAQKKQMNLSADVADTGMLAADQSLILRVAESYFAALKMQATLGLLNEQEAAVSNTYAEISRRQRLGDASKIDLRATGEQVEAIRVKLLNTEMAYKNDELSLTELTGQDVKVNPLVARFDTDGVEIGNVDDWLSKARQNNKQLKMLALQEKMKQSEVDKYGFAYSPKLDLIAQVEGQRASGSGDYGDASNTANSRMLGIQLTVPLTDGYRSARKNEAYHLAEKSRLEYQRMSLEIDKQVNSLWFALKTGKARVESLDRMVNLSRDRLAATVISHHRGARTTLELLGARSDYIAARLSLLEEQVNLILNRLRLASLAGELSEQDLTAANRFIASR
jgi:outer membrane protein